MDEKQQNWCDQEQDSHIGHMAAREQSHMFMQACYGNLCVSYGKFGASVDWIWQKNATSNSRKPVVSKCPIRWNKYCVKTYGVQHFSKTRNI